jgi:hypothetical protein
MTTNLAALAAVAALGVSLACAGPGSPARTVTQTVRVVGTGGSTGMALTSTTEAGTVTVPFGLDEVWNVMPAVYDSVGIQVARLDRAQRVIGNPSLSIRGRLRNVPLSRYLDCGRTQIDFNADTYQINLSVLTQLFSEPNGGTTIATTVEAQARPLQFAQEWLRCTSRGGIEQQIAGVTQAKLRR